MFEEVELVLRFQRCTVVERSSQITEDSECVFLGGRHPECVFLGRHWRCGKLYGCLSDKELADLGFYRVTQQERWRMDVLPYLRQGRLHALENGSYMQLQDDRYDFGDVFVRRTNSKW